jgi:hypothetical protein
MAANDLASVSSTTFKHLPVGKRRGGGDVPFFAVAFFEAEMIRQECSGREKYFGVFRGHASAPGFGGCAVRG